MIRMIALAAVAVVALAGCHSDKNKCNDAKCKENCKDMKKKDTK